jgi:iron complex outermembrane receptor protein/vitamin B12 transporter
VQEISADAQGDFALDALAAGRYQIEASAPGFQVRTTDPMFLGGGVGLTVEIALPIGPREQSISVTAVATDLLTSQTGASVTALDSQTLDALGKTDVFEALRLVPGAQVVQLGSRGSPTSMFIRGGNSNFTKVLIDGIPANDIGGSVDFSQFSNTGVDRVEVLRDANSVQNGADALAGIVNIITRRGQTRTPELSYSFDGGNLSTFRNDVSAGGAVQRVDYFGEYSRLTTDNDLPNNKAHIGTFAGRFGAALGRATALSGIVRQINTRSEFPTNNAGFDFYLLPDDSFSRDRAFLGGAGVQSQMSDRWQASVQFGLMDQRSHYENPTPSGIFDGFNYLGEPVTVAGGNGFAVSTQQIIDYGFSTFPSVFESRTKRQTLYGRTSFHVGPDFDLSAGAHAEREQGFDDPDESPTLTRINGGLFVEARGTLVHRVAVTAGLGYEHNAVFKSAYTPRLSVAVSLRSPSPTAFAGDTRVTFNAGKAVKAPGTFQEQNTLFELLGPAGAANAGISEIGPERARNVDVGLEQGLRAGRARLRVTYFDNEFYDLLEFLSKQQLVQFGVSPEAAAATDFGAYVNASSYRARGAEISVEAAVGGLRFGASYTYLDAEVTESISNLPAFNPAFPEIPIGSFVALPGERPFRRPANVGNLFLTYLRGPAQVTLSGFLAGQADDSTFLAGSDAFFGNSGLLPNQDLNDSYQKIDLSGSYRIHPRVKWYATIENLLDQDYQAAFSFPALPRTVRTGVTLNVGGR